MRLFGAVALLLVITGCSGGEPTSSEQSNSGQATKRTSPVDTSPDPTTAAHRRAELDLIAHDIALFGRLISREHKIRMDRLRIARAQVQGQFYAAIGVGEHTASKFVLVFVPIWNGSDPAYRMTFASDFSFSIEQVDVPDELSINAVLAELGDDVPYATVAALGEIRDAVRVAFARKGLPPKLAAVPELEDCSIPGNYSLPNDYAYTNETGTIELVSEGKSVSVACTFEWVSGDSTFTVGGREIQISNASLQLLSLHVACKTMRSEFAGVSRKTIEERALQVLKHRDGNGKWPSSAERLVYRDARVLSDLFSTPLHRISSVFQDEATGEPQLRIHEVGTDAVCVVAFDPADPDSVPTFSWSK